MKKMRKETVTDSFACAFSASCSYDAVKAQAEQETAAFQRELEQQAEALQQELKRQEKRAAHQREKERKAEEQELRERKREERILERKTRNAEEKYFKCPACGCSFKLTRGWFLNKKECYEKINFLKAKVYKEHTCPYCKSVVQLETGEIRYLIKEPCFCKDFCKDYHLLLSCDSDKCFCSYYASKQEFLFTMKKKVKKSAAKIAAVASVAGVLICLGAFATVEISDKVKSKINSRNTHTDITVQYIGRFDGILDDDGEGVGAWGFYNEAEDAIYWCDETNPFQPFDYYANEIGDVGTALEMQYYPKRSKVKLNGHTFRKIKIEEISKERVHSICEWMT